MVTQYDASAVEANGLLKMDFLGLRNLTFVQKCRKRWPTITVFQLILKLLT